MQPLKLTNSLGVTDLSDPKGTFDDTLRTVLRDCVARTRDESSVANGTVNMIEKARRAFRDSGRHHIYAGSNSRWWTRRNVSFDMPMLRSLCPLLSSQRYSNDSKSEVLSRRCCLLEKLTAVERVGMSDSGSARHLDELVAHRHDQ